MPTPARRLFDVLSPGSERNLLDTLRGERVGGALLLAGTVVALLWANIAPTSYTAVSDTVVGPAALHLDLTLATWATDGLLAIFFFVVGLELKREIVAGELRNPRTAVVPIVAAVGGMVVPAALYLAVNLTSPDGNARGWAVPTATDIAFAVSVLAIVGRSLPNALRAFRLTLAVVDDLLAIIVIGAVYTESVSALWLGVGAATVVVFALLIRRGWVSGWLLVPLGLVAWAAVHASGVHATIAGVALGLVVGKPLGILGATWLVARFTRASLAPGLGWADVAAVGLLGGIGFTVSLLVGELAFGAGSPHDEHVVVAVLVASLVAAVLGGIALYQRDRHHAHVARGASRDTDRTG